jgi:hypothetical protein
VYQKCILGKELTVDQPASKDSEVDPIIDVYPEDSKEYPDFFSQKTRSNTYRGAQLDGRLKQKSYPKHLTRQNGVFGRHQGLQRKSLLVATYLINIQYPGNIAIAMKYLRQELGGCLLEKIWPNFGMPRRIIGIPKKPCIYFWISCK